jgi:hypothetical protein
VDVAQQAQHRAQLVDVERVGAQAAAQTLHEYAAASCVISCEPSRPVTRMPVSCRQPCSG